jgi:hypothetical protein
MAGIRTLKGLFSQLGIPACFIKVISSTASNGSAGEEDRSVGHFCDERRGRDLGCDVVIVVVVVIEARGNHTARGERSRRKWSNSDDCSARI